MLLHSLAPAAQERCAGVVSVQGEVAEAVDKRLWVAIAEQHASSADTAHARCHQPRATADLQHALVCMAQQQRFVQEPSAEYERAAGEGGKRERWSWRTILASTALDITRQRQQQASQTQPTCKHVGVIEDPFGQRERCIPHEAACAALKQVV